MSLEYVHCLFSGLECRLVVDSRIQVCLLLFTCSSPLYLAPLSFRLGGQQPFVLFITRHDSPVVLSALVDYISMSYNGDRPTPAILEKKCAAKNVLRV